MKEIKLTVAPGTNFTPAGLMHRYAKQTAGITYTPSLHGSAQLTIEGSAYSYHHWAIDGDTVTLYLCESERYKGLNLMCRCCTRLDLDCKGTTCTTWTGCVHRRNSKEG